MLYGLLNLSLGGYVIATLILTHLTILGVTLYLHRNQAHRSLDMHPILSHFFRFWLWLTTGMVTKEWTAIHRKHHARCETEDDPHSPQVEGINKVLWEGAELYRLEAKNNTTLEKFGKGTPDDWMERHVYTGRSRLGIVAMILIDILLFGAPGITIWAIQMMWIPFFAAGVINGVAHYVGYRNFEVPDASRNIMPWGILIGGEELHNNHHAHGTSAKFSEKWWEFDIGWAYIQIFRCLGLVKVKRLPAEGKISAERNIIDDETARAVVATRFQLLARYGQRVILPTLQTERRKIGQLGANALRRAKSLLIKDTSLFRQHDQKDLDVLLSDCQQLKEVYTLRLKLQDLWEKTAASQRELIENLQDWCQQAEATGIAALQEFAQFLRGYTLASSPTGVGSA